MTDLLSTARTPTDDEERQLWGEVARIGARKLLHLAAPRILALAYREAAQEVRAVVRSSDDWGPLEAAAQRLESQAAALENEESDNA